MLLTGESTTDETDLLATTSLPELRELAKNFSLALSSYLNDPETFRKSLEGLRPTEPPPLEGNDNIESSKPFITSKNEYNILINMIQNFQVQVKMNYLTSQMQILNQVVQRCPHLLGAIF